MSNKAGLLCLRQCCVSSPWPEGFLQLMVFDRIAMVQAVVSWQATLLFCHGSSVQAKLTWHFVTDIFCDDTAVRGIWMGKHRIKMSLCVCFREMAEREGGKKLALRQHVLFSSAKKCNSHTHSRCQNAIPQTQAKPSNMLMEKNWKDYSQLFEVSWSTFPTHTKKYIYIFCCK